MYFTLRRRGSRCRVGWQGSRGEREAKGRERKGKREDGGGGREQEEENTGQVTAMSCALAGKQRLTLAGEGYVTCHSGP